MTTFRQWHDDDMKFHNETRLYFCQCSARHTISLFELQRLTTDTAVEDYRQRGMSWEILAEHNIAILVSRLAFRFHKMPRANDLITITTWEEKPQPLQLMRTYEITDSETGSLLITGHSAWILVDLNTRRIMRTKDFTMRPESMLSLPHDCMEPGKIIMPEQLQPLGERPIWYSDIDGNGHMNNARYGAFVLDCLPSEYQQKEFTDFRINYSKEAAQGGMLKLAGNFDSDAHKITIIGSQNENTCFESELYYK